MGAEVIEVVQRRRRWSAERAAVMLTLLRTAKLNRIEPEAWLRNVLGRIGEHPINRLDELLPWHWQPLATHLGAAERRDGIAA